MRIWATVQLVIQISEPNDAQFLALALGRRYDYGSAMLLNWDGEADMARGRWTYVGKRGAGKPPEPEKTHITSACEAFIQDVLKPRFLPEIRPTAFNYCVDIFGKWHGGNYRFIQRYRSDDPKNAIEPQFDAPFARLEYVGEDRFDLSYFRHTGQWWTVYCGVPLAEALRLFETEGIFHPIT